MTDHDPDCATQCGFSGENSDVTTHPCTCKKMEEKCRINKWEARHIIAKYVMAHAALFLREDEDVYSGTPKEHLPPRLERYAFPTRFGGDHFFPNKAEKKLMSQECQAIIKTLSKHLTP